MEIPRSVWSSSDVSGSSHSCFAASEFTTYPSPISPRKKLETKIYKVVKRIKCNKMSTRHKLNVDWRETMTAQVVSLSQSLRWYAFDVMFQMWKEQAHLIKESIRNSLSLPSSITGSNSNCRICIFISVIGLSMSSTSTAPTATCNQIQSRAKPSKQSKCLVRSFLPVSVWKSIFPESAGALLLRRLLGRTSEVMEHEWNEIPKPSQQLVALCIYPVYPSLEASGKIQPLSPPSAVAGFSLPCSSITTCLFWIFSILRMFSRSGRHTIWRLCTKQLDCRKGVNNWVNWVELSIPVQFLTS